MGKNLKTKQNRVGKISKNTLKNSYTFCLRPIAQSHHFVPIIVDYHSGFQGKQNKIKQCYPTFLKSQNPFAPSFVVPFFSKSNSTFQYSQCLIDNQLINEENLEEGFSRPEPANRQGLCKLCRYYYDNYWAHIGTNRHNQNMMAAPYRQEIKQFCRERYGDGSICIQKSGDNSVTTNKHENSQGQMSA